MTYPRPAYLAPGIPTEKTKLLFVGADVDVPKFEYPITPLENFRRAAARANPLWVPNSPSDVQDIMTQDLVTGNVRGMQLGADFSRMATEDYTFYDWFGSNWTWVCSAGGAMLTPGTCLCGDITQWESIVKFPNIHEWDWQTYADSFLKNTYDPSKVLHINIGLGATERLIATMGGYTEGLIAMAVEPKAVRGFINRFIDFTIEWFDLLYQIYPINMITYHDDWGTERATFYSPQMFEDLIFGPTKRLVDHIKSKNVIFELHSCGNVTSFIPYMIELGVDFLQIQRRAVNTPAMKKKYGDKIGFNVGLEGMEFGASYTKDALLRKVRETVDIYGKGGGVYVNVMERDPQLLWAIMSELYAYSREFYDKERGE